MKITSFFLSRAVFRVLIYCLLTFLLAEFLIWDAGVMAFEDRFSEASYTEDMQVALLLISSLILVRVYTLNNQLSIVALLFSGFTMASMVRELDNVFDRLIGSWQYPAYAIVAIVMYACWKNRQQLLTGIVDYTYSLSFGLFLAGTLTTYIFSRLFGSKKFWNTLLEEHLIRIAKNAAEEGTELLGYFIIFLSVIEFYLMIKHQIRVKRC